MEQRKKRERYGFRAIMDRKDAGYRAIGADIKPLEQKNAVDRHLYPYHPWFLHISTQCEKSEFGVGIGITVVIGFKSLFGMMEW